MVTLNIPPVPAALKSLTPYLQRAEELKVKDPVIAYWCTYYAAQQGIALRVSDSSVRTFLFGLLDLLEHVKAEIGKNDAITDDAASAAYVENFALRVFASADNEDRKGGSTRATAKKFLAAANFLEVLSSFSSSASTASGDIPEKIRYAKWKAADIAKAIREGRKPTPGAPGEVQAEEQGLGDTWEMAPGAGEVAVPPQSSAPPQIQHTLSSDTPVDSPGAWSTVASVGTPGDIRSGGAGGRHAWVSGELEGREHEYDNVSDEAEKKVRFAPGVVGGEVLSPFSDIPPPSDGVEAHGDVDEGAAEDIEQKLRRFDVKDGGAAEGIGSFQDASDGALLPDVPSAPSAPPEYEQGESEPTFSLPSAPPDIPSLPPHNLHTSPPAGHPPLPPPPSVPFFPPADDETDFGAPPPSESLPPPPVPPPTYTSPPPGPAPPPHAYTSPSQPTYHSHVPPAPSAVPSPQAPRRYAPPPPPAETPPRDTFTPQEIGRIQKHCKFAISALDYEDAETARKELRAALTMLGG